MSSNKRRVKWFHLQHLGKNRFPDTLTPVEIEQFFVFSDSDRRAIKRYRKPEHQLGIALLVGFMRMTGARLIQVETIPGPLLTHLRDHLGVDVPDLASLRTLYAKRSRTLFTHQEWARKFLGIKLRGRRVSEAYRELLVERAVRTDSVEVIVCEGCRFLYERKYGLPPRAHMEGDARFTLRKLDELAHAAIVGALGQPRVDELHQFLEEKGDGTVRWLRRRVKGSGPAAIDELILKVQFLRELKLEGHEFAGVSLDAERKFAARFRGRKPSRHAQIEDPAKTIEWIAFLRVCLMESVDEALMRMRFQSFEVEKKARVHVKNNLELSLRDCHERFDKIRETVRDKSLTHSAARVRVGELVPASKARSRNAAYRERLSADARQSRRLLKQIVLLEFEPLDHVVVKMLCDLRRFYKKGSVVLPRRAIQAVPRRWADLVDSCDRRRAFRAYEACTLEMFRSGLHRGDIWVPISGHYRNRQRHLYSKKEWQNKRKNAYQQLGLSRVATRFVDPMLRTLEAGLAETARAVEAGRLTADRTGLHLPPLHAEEVPAHLDSYRQAILGEMGSVDFPDVIVEMDSHVHFSGALLGRQPASATEILTLYGAVLVFGTNISAAQVARMIDGITDGGVRSMMLRVEAMDGFDRANASVVDFLRRQPIASTWGQGNTASADAMNMETSKHLWSARIDPRQRHHAVGLYTHVLDQWGIIYDQPVLLNERQAGAALDGALKQQAVPELEALAVDTHGQTDFAMAVAKMLGSDLCPRLRNLKHRRLHVLEGMTIPGVLSPVTRDDVSLDAIKTGWDDLVRVIASIDDGRTSCTAILERFESSRSDPIHRAGVGVGRLLKTIFLCDYHTNVRFRRELLRVLNYGESVHSLQRTIHAGPLTTAEGTRPGRLEAISGGLTLLTNLSMAWVAHELQRACETLSARGQPVPDDVLAHIAPVQRSCINYRGRFLFPIERYQDELLQRGLRIVG